MTQFVLAISGYLFSGMIILFTLCSFWGLKAGSEKIEKKISGMQIGIMTIFHVLAYTVFFYLTSDPNYLYFFAFQILAFLTFHVLCRAIYPNVNRFLVNFICFFLIVGLVILTRISLTKCIKQFVIAAVSMAIVLLLPLLVKKMKFLSSMPAFYGVLGLGLLSVVYLYGAVTNGSKISYTIFDFTFQPSEFVKIIYIFFLAAMLHRSVKLHRIFLTAVIACIHVVILVFSKDLGSALIFFVAFICVLFVSTKKPLYLILGCGSACVASVFAYRLFTHVQVRFLAWQDPWSNIDKEGYQITQSLFAICSGKWFGMGLMHGSPKSIPFVEADFVFSAIAQELGVIFAVTLVLTYLACFLHILKIAMHLRNRFYKIISVGLGVIMIFQVFLTIGGGVKLIPSTGVTLPLISYGGSSVMSTMIMFGILIGISLVSSIEKETGCVYADGFEDGMDEYETGFEAGFQKGLSNAYDLVAVDPQGRTYGFNYDEYGYAYDKFGNIYDQNGYPCDRDGVVYSRNDFPEIYNRPETRAILYLKNNRRNGSYEQLSSTNTKQNRSMKKGKNKTNGLRNTKYKNLEVVIIGIVFLCVFVGMDGYIGKYVYAHDYELISNDYNPVQAILIKQNSRGTIYSCDGEEIAYSEMVDGKEVRVYPYKDLFCHVVGYSSLGRCGIEDYANSYLIQCNASLNTKMEAELDDRKNPGDSIYTTLDVEIQQAAKSALGMYKGAIILTDVKTGKVLCMYSNPGFDPNEIEDIWEKVSKDESSTVLLNRASQGLYPPGSTFKIITSLEYLQQNPEGYQNYYFTCNGRLSTSAGTIRCYHSTNHGGVDFRKSFAKSCNSSFANIGLSLDRKKFGESLKDLMFDSALPYDLSYSRSHVDMNEETDDYNCMQTSIGQGTTIMTPLHLNMITCAIANKGVLMKPYFVTEVVNADGNTVKTFADTEYKRLLSEENAELLTEFMTAVVEEGTGTKLKGQSYTAAGKTGSAEYNSNNDSHAWFTGFAPADDPQVAITVIVESAGSGGDFAVPMAKTVLNAYFEQ